MLRTSRDSKTGTGATAASGASPRRHDRGYVLALTALLMTGLLGATALAVDLGAWFARATTLQRIADAASLAGVTYMPNETAVNDAVDEVLARNGLADGVDGIDVNIDTIGNSRVEVSIRDTDADQFFSGIFSDNVEIERGAIAEYIKPVPLGSPRNFLGTGHLRSGEARENLWLAAAGQCVRREQGDRITARADGEGVGDTNNGNIDSLNNSFVGCDPSTPDSTLPVIDNPEFDETGYWYIIELDDGDDNAGEPWPFAPRVDIFDAPFCNASSQDSGGQAEADFFWTLTAADSPLDPEDATPLAGFPLEIDQSGNTCSATGSGGRMNRWYQLGSLPAEEGIYYLNIRPEEPADKTKRESNNLFSIRAVNPGWVSPTDNVGNWGCTADANVATTDNSAPYRTDCPRVYGYTHLGVYAKNPNSDPSFFLADIGQQHEGKQVTVELYDTAEGADEIRIKDPAGNDVQFTWEVGCQDGSYPSESGACSTGENAPNGGYGNTTGYFVDVSGTWNWDQTNPHCRFRPWGCHNAQNGKYSGRLLRLRFDLPYLEDNPTWYGQGTGAAWFRIKYITGSGGVGDRTTWSLEIRGDPVRLVE